MTRMVLGLVASLLLAAASGHPAAWAQDSSRAAAGNSGVPVFATAFAVAACSTVLVLAFVVRSSRKARARRRRAAGTEIPAGRDMQEIVETAGDEEERFVAAETSAPEDDEAEAEAEAEEFYGVGEGLRGTREELALAMRLHSGTMGESTRRRAMSACSADATTAERVRAAKKLGIGRGEIDLALRLRKLETNAPGEGETT